MLELFLGTGVHGLSAVHHCRQMEAGDEMIIPLIPDRYSKVRGQACKTPWQELVCAGSTHLSFVLAHGKLICFEFCTLPMFNSRSRRPINPER